MKFQLNNLHSDEFKISGDLFKMYYIMKLQSYRKKRNYISNNIVQFSMES